MTRPEITAKLSAMIEKKINPHNDPRIYWAKEVTFDYSTDHGLNTIITEEDGCTDARFADSFGDKEMMENG